MFSRKIKSQDQACQSSEKRFPLMKSMTWETDCSSAAVTATRFCMNSSAVGLSPSTKSVTAFTNIAGTLKRSATYATAAP